MAQNLTEYHIRQDSRLTFKVKAGATLYAGQVVEVSGDMEVAPAAANSEKVLGVVYGGTVGNSAISMVLDDQTLVGFSGDRKEKVSVIHNGHFIYAPMTGVVAGDGVTAGAAGAYAKFDAAAGKAPAKLGIVVSANTKVAGQVLIYLKG